MKSITVPGGFVCGFVCGVVQSITVPGGFVCGFVCGVVQSHEVNSVIVFSIFFLTFMGPCILIIF